DGWSDIDLAIFIAFAIAAPWSVLGFCNAMLGFWLLHMRPDALAKVAPFANDGDAAAPLKVRVAMLMTIRNEDPARAFARLRAMKASVGRTGEAASFDWFMLSDSTDPEIAAREEAAFAKWRLEGDAARLHYRRRPDNLGYKAGNISDFCERWGDAYEFMIPLDADSLMDGETILRLTRVGQANPGVGIIQTLVAGSPSASAFARIFQFGMRAGMRVYTMGAAWWGGDCGPFWGHNALVRVAPFAAHCALPKLDGDRYILSHDQLEAVLMRRAGFEVRVLPLEWGSFEENPPTLVDFLRRDLRWCRGNLQYFKLLSTPGLTPTSRFQLIWAIAMFIGAPAWTAIIALAAMTTLQGGAASFPVRSTQVLYCLFLGFYFAPKLAGYIDVARTPGGFARYGGAVRFFAGALIEALLSFVIGAAATLQITLYLLSLPFHGAIRWDGQPRDAYALSLSGAVRAMWPQLLFGTLVFCIGATRAPKLLLWSLPLTAGYLLAIPAAIVTAWPRLGRWMASLRLCAIPEEFDRPAIFALLAKEEEARSEPKPAKSVRAVAAAAGLASDA
ncbi:MAG TPA: glucans biosynthesis glucosyltransferase MdoH, partial [Methylocystis sp.]